MSSGIAWGFGTTTGLDFWTDWDFLFWMLETLEFYLMGATFFLLMLLIEVYFEKWVFFTSYAERFIFIIIYLFWI